MSKNNYIRLFAIKKFPIFMGGVDKSFKTQKQDMNFEIEKKSGKVRIYPRVPLKKLYKYQHGEGTTGKTWQKHHQMFFNFCKKYIRGNILEIGAGSNSIVKYISDFSKINNFISIGKNLIKDKQNKKIKFIDNFIEIKNLKHEFDLIIHSHFFEHIFDPNIFLKSLSKKLKYDGFHIFSMPNMKPMIKQGLANVVSFEHPYYYDQELTENYLTSNYFQIKKKILFGKSHSVMYQTKLSKKKTSFSYNRYKENKKLFKSLFVKWESDVKKINKLLIEKKKVYLFGAHIFSQLIIYLNLRKGILGILDNDKSKQNKYLNGTNYKIFSPEILKKHNKVYVYLKAGEYNLEIKRQIKKINKNITFI